MTPKEIRAVARAAFERTLEKTSVILEEQSLVLRGKPDVSDIERAITDAIAAECALRKQAERERDEYRESLDAHRVLLAKAQQDRAAARRERDAALANLRLARAGMPGLGVVQFDSEETAKLREDVVRLERERDAAQATLADEQHQLTFVRETCRELLAEHERLKVENARLNDILTQVKCGRDREVMDRSRRIDQLEEDNAALLKRVERLEAALRRIAQQSYCNGRQDRQGKPDVDCDCSDCITRVALAPGGTDDKGGRE